MIGRIISLLNLFLELVKHKYLEKISKKKIFYMARFMKLTHNLLKNGLKLLHQNHILPKNT
jgi:hypothetical protein